MSFVWLPNAIFRRDVKIIQGQNDNSTTRATLLTPTSGTTVNVIDVNIDFKGVTANGLEVYFDTGANIDSDDSKAIQRASQAAFGAVLFKFDDIHRPRGAVDDVVSIRGIAGVASQIVDILLRYWED